MSLTERPDSPSGFKSRMIVRAADDDVDPIDPRPVPRPASEELTAAVPPATPAPAIPRAVPAAVAETIAAVTPEIPVQEAQGAGELPEKPAPPRRNRRPEMVVQMNARLTLTARDQLDAIAERERITIRNALEKAIALYYNQ